MNRSGRSLQRDFFVAVAAAMLASVPLAAHAALSDPIYQYTDPDNVVHTSNNLAELEAIMRSQYEPPGQLLERVDTEISAYPYPTNKIKYHYAVPDHPFTNEGGFGAGWRLGYLPNPNGVDPGALCDWATCPFGEVGSVIEAEGIWIGTNLSQCPEGGATLVSQGTWSTISARPDGDPTNTGYLERTRTSTYFITHRKYNLPCDNPDNIMISGTDHYTVYERYWYECPEGMWITYFGGQPVPFLGSEDLFVCRDLPGLGESLTDDIFATIKQPPPDCTVGDPCDPASGNQIETEVDFRGAGLELVRTYNSRQQVGGMAPGWSHNYQRHLMLDGFHDPVVAVRSGGEEVPLQRQDVVSGNGESEYFSRAGSDFSIHYTSSTVEWILTTANGAKEYYDKDDGKLLRLEDREGRVTTLVYDEDQGQFRTGPLLSEVTGPFGHKLTFIHEAQFDGERTRWVLVEVNDPAAQSIRYEYEDGSQNLTKVTYQDESYRTYLYEDPNSASLLTGIVDEQGLQHASFAYDEDGRAEFNALAGGTGATDIAPSPDFSSAVVTDGDGKQRSFGFTDANGVARTTSFTDEKGARSWVVTGVRSRKTSSTDQNAADLTTVQTTYDYNDYVNGQTNVADLLNLASVTEAVGTAQQRTTYFEQYLSTWEHSLPGKIRQPSVCSQANHEKVTLITYGGKQIDGVTPVPMGDRLVNDIQISGFTADCSAIERRVQFRYDEIGRVVHIDGPRTDVDDSTELAYYDACTTGEECGQLESMTNALGQVTTFDDYDGNGRLAQTTDPNGLVTSYAYDPRGRLQTVTQTPPAGQGDARTTSFTYYLNGLLYTATTPGGTQLTYTYDTLGAWLLDRVTDNLGNYIKYLYDGRGNRSSEDIYDSTNALRRNVDYVYDVRNRLERINAAGSVTDLLFDTLGNLRRERTPNQYADDPDPDTGLSTTHAYDALSRVIQTIDPLNGQNAPTDYGYDAQKAQDAVASVTDPNGAQTIYTYDDLGNLRSVDSPDSGLTTYDYDNAGNRTQQTDARDVVTNYAYDELNRLTAVTYPGDSSLDVDNGYDNEGITSPPPNGIGRLTSIDDVSGHTELQYDAFGELTLSSKQLVGPLSAWTFETSYGYDDDGHVIQVGYPSGRTVDYVRNVLGQATSVTTTTVSGTSTVAQNIQYMPFGPMKGLTYGNGLVETRGFDQQYRIATQLITKPGPTTVFSFTYTPDLNGNFEDIHSNVQSTASQTFEYDDLDRLFDASTALALYGHQVFDYDGVGNRTLFTDNAAQSVLTYDTATPSNRLQTITGTGAADFDYDEMGNITTYDLTGVRYLTFEYDDATHLTRVLQRDEFGADIEIVRYVYNSLGQRVEKQLAGGDLFYYWYGLDGELLAETDSGGATIIEYAYLNGAPLALLASDQDGDGILDTDDNCITRQNATSPNNQVDSNGDGFGNACDGDLNNDGTVNGADLTIIQNVINAGTYNAAADLNFNGAVTNADKAILMSMFGQPPGPAGGGDGDALQKREYVLTDHRGAPFALSNANKVTVWKANYEPFGYTNLNEDEDLDAQPVVLNLRFPGQYFDAETGLYYNWHRYYDPTTGRYTSSDPIGLVGGLNTYAYVGGNPIGYIDPTGEFGNLVIGAVTGVATGYLISLATGECYELDDLLLDAAFGATGAGLVAKLEMLRDIARLRQFAKDRGLVAKKVGSQVEDYVNPANPIERLKIKKSPSRNAPGSLSQAARVEYKVAPGTYQNPFTGEVGRTVEYSHVPIGTPSTGGAVAGGALGGGLAQTVCGCRR